MDNTENKICSCYISEDEIKSAVQRLGKEISKDYIGKNLLMICILKGASVFMSDLIREVELPLDIDFMSVSSYGSGTQSSFNVKIIKDISCSIENRDVLIVEDIIDTGNTLSKLVDMLGERNPASLKICTLLDKPEMRCSPVNVDYVGFKIENKFIVGYGLDYDEKYRNLKYIGIYNN